MRTLSTLLLFIATTSSSLASDPPPLVPQIRAAVQPEIDKHLAAAQTETFRELAIADAIKAHFKPPLRQRAVKDPWGALTDLEARGLSLAASSRGGLRNLATTLDKLDAFLDRPAAPVATGRVESGDLASYLRRIEAVLDGAALTHKSALADLSTADRESLFARPAKLIHEFSPQETFNDKTKPMLQDDLTFCTAWEQKIDRNAFVASMKALLLLSDPDFLDAFKSAAEKAPRQPVQAPLGVTGDVLFVRETKHGLIIIGGPGKNTYDLKQPVAFLADLGGDDVYKGTIASSFDADHPFSIVVDYAGNDRYESSELGLATGRLGVGLLIDRAGDDHYQLAPGSGGCGFAGVGILVDESGKDEYIGTRFTQGAAIAGVGLLLDMSGDDLYTAHDYALGIGGAAGVGAVIDVAGNDHYRCGFHTGSGYNSSDAPTAKPGDPNYQYDAFGLGIGIGRRTYPPSPESSEFHLAGGVGVWLDLAGDDRSESSNFSQACAYFFGIGLKMDLAGNDQHKAARYGHAAGAHYGLGLFLDYDGNDLYEGAVTYNMGCAWDRSVFLLADGRGDDVYDWTRSSGGGRADRGGWAVFADLAGADTYKLNGVPGGASQKALAVFYDAAGLDSYPKPTPTRAPANNLTLPTEGSLFIDR